MDTREDHGSYYPGGEKVIPIREVSGNVKKVNGIAPDAAGNVQVPTDDTDAVRFTAQSLTDSQKAQARSNIGAIASAPVTSVNNKTGEVTLTAEDIKYDEETPLYTKIADTAYTASTAEEVANNAAMNISSHVDSNNNPHDVTAEQVGALPLSGGTMTGNIILPNGKGIEFFDNTASVAILEVNPNYADDGRIYLPAQTGTLALKSEIPAAVVVDQALNASSSNPLANSAVAASLPYKTSTRAPTFAYDENFGYYGYYVKPRCLDYLADTDAHVELEDGYTTIIFDIGEPSSYASQCKDAMVVLDWRLVTEVPPVYFVAKDGESAMATYFYEDSVTTMEIGKVYIATLTILPLGSRGWCLGVKVVEAPNVQQEA